MPTKEEFQNTFKLIGYSNHCEYYHDSKNKQRAEMALNILEQIKSRRVEVPSFTIEHILPDSQNREHAMIGNLIPLEENLNSSCKDKPLYEKISIYDHETGSIDDELIYDDFYAFLNDLYDLLGIGE